MPLGALRGATRRSRLRSNRVRKKERERERVFWLNEERGRRGGGRKVRGRNHTTYRASSSCCCLRNFTCIIRQVKFSIRSWLGNCCFVLVKNFHTCVASGSCFC